MLPLIPLIRRKSLSGILALASLLVFFQPQSAMGEPQWSLFHSDQGVRVYRKELPGQNHLVFKAVGVVKGDWLTTLATIADLNQATQWVERLAEVKVLKIVDLKERIIYSRFTAPWPLSDRDVVLRGKIEFDPKSDWVFMQTANTQFGQIDGQGAVRMPLVRNTWRLRPIQNGQATYIEFEAQADPGGVIPAWVSNMVSKDIPFNTIVNLRKQVAKGYVNRAIIRQLHAQVTASGLVARRQQIEARFGDLVQR